MAIHVEFDDHDEQYVIWSNPEPGDRYSGRCIGLGATLDEAKESARDELLGDIEAIDALDDPTEDPREKGEDDGREYGHPGDRLKGID